MFAATQPSPQFYIVHACTSQLNKLSIHYVRKYIIEYCKTDPFFRQIKEPNVYGYPNEKLWEFMLYINETLPIMALQKYGHWFKDKQAVKNAELLSKASTKMHDMQI